MNKRKIMLSLVLVLSLGLLFYSQARCATEVEIQNTYFDAIIAGDLKAVKQFLTNDPNLVSAVDTRGKGICRPALHLAVMYGHSDIVELLLSKGAKANVRNVYGVSALEVAAGRGHANVVAPLVSYGGDINGEQHKLRRSPLCCASNGEVAEALIANGADVMQRDKLEITPLHFVAKDGATEAAKVLIKHGAKVDARNKMGRTPLHEAAGRGHLEMVTFLVEKGADINGKSKAGSTPLSLAVEPHQDPAEQRPFYDVAEFLLSKGSSHTIFEVASLGDVTRVHKLLEESSELANFRVHREPVLIAVVRQGHKHVVELLLDYGAKIDVKGRHGEPPLHSAAHKGYKDIVEILLQAGADVNQKGAHGELSLHWAAAKGHLEVVELLLDAGSDVNAKTDKVRANMNIAVDENFDVVKECLRYSDASRRQWEAEQAGVLSYQIMGLIRVVFAAGDTLLHSASQWGREGIVRLLLKNGADVNAVNKYGQSPLHYACVFGHQNIKQLLINKGADINAKDENGYTPQELSSFAEWVSH